jgi:hypothetical protein
MLVYLKDTQLPLEELDQYKGVKEGLLEITPDGVCMCRAEVV